MIFAVGQKGEKMSDLISRQAAIDALADYICMVDAVYSTGLLTNEDCEECARSVLDNIPPAQPERTGKWEVTYLDHESMGNRPRILYCSKCNQCIAYPTNYCPHCGADMRGDV